MTISVNTNWFNGFNLERVFSFLSAELDAVREALGHLREEMSGGDEEYEWERQCEIIMRANSALNLTEFAAIVIGRARHLLASSVGSAPDDAPGDRKSTGFQGTAASRGPDALCWRKVALRQAADVLGKLAMEPCRSHLFLKPCDGIDGDGPMQHSRGSEEEDDANATDLDSTRLLHEARSSIERFLGETLYRTTPENNCT